MDKAKREDRRGPMRRRAIGVACGAAAGVGLWIAGVLWFAALIPRPPAGERPPAEPVAAAPTDAIVVLTGGALRLEEGLDLLAAGKAWKLFVSGVYHGVDVQSLMRLARRAPYDIECCVVLGYTAGDTAGNARETAAWMAAEGYRSLRLVTASYHMPRSLLAFRRALAGVTIVPHPVFPPSFKQDRWYLWPGTARLIVSEFHKYVFALAHLA